MLGPSHGYAITGRLDQVSGGALQLEMGTLYPRPCTASDTGLGADLFLAAGERALAVAQKVGGVGLAIDAKDERAGAWYERFGALRLLDDPLKLVLPLDTISAALKR